MRIGGENLRKYLLRDTHFFTYPNASFLVPIPTILASSHLTYLLVSLLFKVGLAKNLWVFLSKFSFYLHEPEHTVIPLLLFKIFFHRRLYYQDEIGGVEDGINFMNY